MFCAAVKPIVPGCFADFHVLPIPRLWVQVNVEVAMKSIIVEVRAAEGGIDSKKLTEDLAGAYVRRCARKGL
jgi:hypothetical protein